MLNTYWLIGINEYCQFESFRATCQENHVVVMQVALYGRMNLGRCVKKDLGYVGACSIDVMEHVDRQCSGRHDCEFPVSVLNSVMIRQKQQCLEELKFYLEASYSCLEVISPPKEKCWSSREINITQPSGTIASVVTADSGCGSNMAPWAIIQQPGQRINLTLIDFERNAAQDEDERRRGISPCRAYAIIRERGSRDAVTVCGGSSRERHIYLSDSNKVDIRIISRKEQDKTSDFLIKFQVVGCPDIAMPNYVFKRRGDSATIGCLGSEDKRSLHCKGTEWQGDFGNCTPVHGASSDGAKLGSYKLSLKLSVFVIVAIAIIISVAILVIGVVCIKRRRERKARNNNRVPPQKDVVYTGSASYATQAVYKDAYGKHKHNHGGNEYACICELPLPPPPTGGESTSGYRAESGMRQYHTQFSEADSGYPGYGSGARESHAYESPLSSIGGEERPSYFELDPHDVTNHARRGSGQPVPL